MTLLVQKAKFSEQLVEAWIPLSPRRFYPFSSYIDIVLTCF